MAASSCSVFLIFAFFFLMIISSSSSSSSISSTTTTSTSSNSSNSVVLFQLTHSLSDSKFKATHHLLKSTTTRSAARFLNHRHRQVSVPLSPGSDYTMSISLGAAAATKTNTNSVVSVYMDTGSDTVWVPCKPFTCILCEGKSDPKHTPLPLNLTSSATPVTCQSRACSSVHSGLPSSHLCAMARCPLESIEMSECNHYSCPPFYYAYGDGSFVARLYTDTLRIPPSNNNLLIQNFTFGCAHEALGEPIGVAGFGRGPLSLPAQLAPHLGNHFSYCLVSHSFETDRLRLPSPLILGPHRPSPTHNQNQRLLVVDDDFAYTPMLHNSKRPYYYYVALEAITVGNRRLTAPLDMKTIDPKGNGGVVVDSGTTYTMLPQGFYNSVVSEFGKRLHSGYKRAGSVEDRTGLSPCYYTTTTSTNNNTIVPKLVFHFGRNSSSSVSVVMPKRNYFYEFIDIHNDTGADAKKVIRRNVGCMTLMNAGYFPDSGGPAGLLGNYQQQGLEVVYDLLNNRVGFARRKCSSLWDTIG